MIVQAVFALWVRTACSTSTDAQPRLHARTSACSMSSGPVARTVRPPFMWVMVTLPRPSFAAWRRIHAGKSVASTSPEMRIAAVGCAWRDAAGIGTDPRQKAAGGIGNDIRSHAAAATGKAPGQRATPPDDGRSSLSWHLMRPGSRAKPLVAGLEPRASVVGWPFPDAAGHRDGPKPALRPPAHVTAVRLHGHLTRLPDFARRAICTFRCGPLIARLNRANQAHHRGQGRRADGWANGLRRQKKNNIMSTT